MKRSLVIAMGITLAWCVHTYAADSAADILRKTGVQGGLIVHVGCGDASLTAALRAGNGYLVHGLDTDPARIAAARVKLVERGLAGNVSVARFDGKHLPYIDGLVNLVVADDLGGVPMDEVMRVLAPGGVAYIAGKTTVRPRPAQIDQWSHFLYDASNNAVAHDQVVADPFHVQWVGAPKWARHHNHLSSTSGMVSAGGRLFAIMDLGPVASPSRPPEWYLVARDAFNGVVLWSKPVGPWEGALRGFRSGPNELPRRLVATADRVYVTLGYQQPVTALAAASGEVAATYDQTKDAVEMLHADGMLYAVIGRIDPAGYEESRQIGRQSPPPTDKRIVAVDTTNGNTRWVTSNDDTRQLMPTTLCVGGGSVYFHSPTHLVCLDAASGKQRWRVPRELRLSRIAWSSPTLVYHDGVVLSGDRVLNKPNNGPQGEAKRKGKRKGKEDKVTATPNGTGEVAWTVTSNPRAGGDLTGSLVAFDATDGKQLWQTPTAMGYCSPPDVFVADGLAWIATAEGRNTVDFTEGRDLRTGKVKRRLTTDAAFTETHHHRCYRNKATDRYILLGRTGVELIGLDGGDPTRNCWVRGACQYGVLPANGLLYTPPHACACYIQSKLSGLWALAPQKPQPTFTDSPARLVKGPAFGKIPSPKSEIPNPSDWPTFRHDPGRTGRTNTEVPTNLTRAWSADLGGKLTSLVIADGRVVLASIDTHTIHAISAADGEPQWQFIAGGRVDSPPTVHGQLVLFGCADGYVYCLRATDGKLAWRFNAAPVDQRTVSFGQVESVWPVTGSVLVRQGVVYCTAGRSSFLDGGMLLHRLDAATGKLIGTTVFNNRDPKTGGQPEALIEDTELPGALPDVLVDDGQFIYLRDNVLCADGVQQPGFRTHLYSSAGLLDDNWWHRTYWIWGERTWGRASGWGVIPNYRPSGRILVTDDHTVFGYGRKQVKSHRLSGHHLFRADKEVTEIDRQVKNNNVALAKYQKPAKVNELWSQSVPVIARGLVLADNALFAAGPAAPDEDEFAPFDDKAPSVLMAFDPQTGRELARRKLPAQPVFDGLAAAQGRLFIATTNGKVICLTGQ